MRSWLLIAVSSAFRLTNSSKSHVGNTECRMLKFRILTILYGMMCIQNSMTFRQVLI